MIRKSDPTIHRPTWREQGLHPFFSYFGSKWRIAMEYPAPKFSTIIEPFAGSAGYSLRWYKKNVVLNDVNPVITGLWSYLVAVDPIDILKIRADINNIAEMEGCCDSMRSLVGFWLNKGNSSPCLHRTSWSDDHHWGSIIRSRVAKQVRYIRHWKIVCNSYKTLDNVEATWFIDPPYQQKETQRYLHKGIDYEQLARWIKSRRGQVIACSGPDEDYLPFRLLCQARTKFHKKDEYIWTN